MAMYEENSLVLVILMLGVVGWVALSMPPSNGLLFMIPFILRVNLHGFAKQKFFD